MRQAQKMRGARNEQLRIYICFIEETEWNGPELGLDLDMEVGWHCIE